MKGFNHIYSRGTQPLDFNTSTNLHGGGGGDVVVTVHEDLRLDDGDEARLLHSARVTGESPCVLLKQRTNETVG